MTLNRRMMLAGLAGAAALPMMPRLAAAAGTTPVKLQLAWIPNVEYAGVWEAIEHGYMTQEGVDFSYLPGGPNALQGPVAVASGAADLGITGWLPLIDSVNKGNDFVAVAVPYQKSPLGLLSLAKKPILKPADLVGATFLGSGATVKATIEATLKLNNLPADPKIVSVGYSVEPLLAGQGDAQVGFATDQPLQLKNMGMTEGKDYFFAYFDDLGFKSYSAMMFTSRKFLDANRDAVKGLVKALIKGWHDNETDPADAAKLAVDKYGMDYSLNYDQQLAENKVQNTLLHPTGKPDYPLMQFDRDLVKGDMVRVAKVSGRTQIPDIDKMIDFSIAEEAHKEIAAEG